VFKQKEAKSHVPKSRAKFLQREAQFNTAYERVVSDWRKKQHHCEFHEHLNLEEDIEAKKKPDISIYKERNEDYKIIGNNILTRAQETERKYENKENLEILQKTFDPIRIRLRIMPSDRVESTQGKTAAYYFKEAAKKSMAGELTYGIEYLKKGLLNNPNHIPCRFNHGVLLFKFGLIKEALSDFDKILKQQENHPRPELWAYFNHAICLIQLEEIVFPSEIEAAIATNEKHSRVLF